MKKKVLYITTLLPYPPDMGGKIKTLSTLKQLVKDDDVYLFAFVDKRGDLVYQRNLIRIGIKKCFTIVHPIIAERHRITQLITLIKSFFTLKPYSVFKYYAKSMVDNIDNFLEENKVDVVWIDHTIQTQYLPKDFSGFKVLETHNFKTDLFRDMFFAEDKPFWKLFSFYEWLKFKFYEPRQLSRFDLVYAISEKENDKISQFNKNTKTLFPHISPTGNLGKFETKKLFFVGLLTWYPNKQGISWFIKEVFPKLKKDIPELKLDIVGDYSSRWKRPEYEGVKFHGYVADIKRFWRQASIFIVPLRYGSGIRIKILEALANGIPVVSSTEGADGLSKAIKRRIFIADNKREFIDKIGKLLERKEFYFRIINNERLNE